MSKVHGTTCWNNLLHLEHDGRLYHVEVSGDGWHARCVEMGITAEGSNQAQTLDRLMAKVTYQLAVPAMPEAVEASAPPRTIYIDGKQVPLKRALKIITEDWIDSGNSCHQTVLDLVAALKDFVK